MSTKLFMFYKPKWGKEKGGGARKATTFLVSYADIQPCMDYETLLPRILGLYQ